MAKVPIRRPRPDCEAFLDVVLGRSPIKDRPPLVEYIVDDAVIRSILADMGYQWVPRERDEAAYWDLFVRFWYHMGYDFVRYEVSLPFPARSRTGTDPTRIAGERSWAETRQGPIGSWDDFERYVWPEVTDDLFRPFEEISRRLPDGMGLVACHAAGIFEHVSELFGYEQLCYLLHDDPDLVQAVCDAVGEQMVRFYETLLQFEKLIAVFQGDDMGHRTGTLVSPDHLRKYFLPWHKRFAEMAHRRGLPYFLHSCGNVTAIMDDLVDIVGIDGKHSFEDAIRPAEEFHARYGGRIATLGGVDVNVLAKGSPEDVRSRTRALIDACAPLGRFAVGSGNSIPSYVPVANYLAMLEEALS